VGRYIVVDGDPGAGKTTAISSLSMHPSTISLSELDHISGVCSGLVPNLEMPGEWYLDLERQRQTEVANLIRAGRCVIQDRSFLSTLAFSYARCSSTVDEGRLLHLIERAMTPSPLIAPDALLILTVEVATSLRRRSAFARSPNHKFWFDLSFLQRFHDFFQIISTMRLAHTIKLLNTTFLTRAEVNRWLASQLNRALAKNEFNP
jgi:thymidylate kinase